MAILFQQIKILIMDSTICVNNLVLTFDKCIIIKAPIRVNVNETYV